MACGRSRRARRARRRHALNNPDPAGDDYDRQYNPGGTEGNFLREVGEPFDDVGLDGVRCPSGLTCNYDFGEGNGRFDTPAGSDQAHDRNPRALYASLPATDAHRLGFWVDGGIRDALQFGVNANHFVGAIAQRDEQLHIFNNFSALITGRDPPANSDVGYSPRNIDFDHFPRHSMVRYGFLDAAPDLIEMGDGAHVSTGDQLANRILTAVYWLQSSWPNGNRTLMPYSAQPDDAGRCANGYFCTLISTPIAPIAPDP